MGKLEMDEKFRHRKNSPQTPRDNSEDTAGSENVPENDMNDTYSQAPKRRVAPGYRQPENYSHDRRGERNYHSKYDEVQPSYNASRQEFEQRQARQYRRFDSRPGGGAARPQNGGFPPSRGAHYEQPPRRYGSNTPYNDRPYGSRPEPNGGVPRYRSTRDNAPSGYQGFKKQGKHSNDPLPKKVRERRVTIIKALTKMHYGSRNICLQAIRDGLVKINDIPVTKQNAPYVQSDVVTVNNVPLRADEHHLYMAFNKPRKLSGSAEHGEASIVSALQKKEGWYFPVGCLNKAAGGIVIVTNDPAHKSDDISPIAAAVKEYHVKIHKKPTTKELEFLKKLLLKLEAQGVIIQDVALLKETSRHAWLSITLLKGKLTELRKAIKEAGFEILAFDRYRVGGFTADELLPGSWKRLTEDEVNLLKSSEQLATADISDTDDKKPKWQQLYQQWFKST